MGVRYDIPRDGGHRGHGRRQEPAGAEAEVIEVAEIDVAIVIEIGPGVERGIDEQGADEGCPGTGAVAAPEFDDGRGDRPRFEFLHWDAAAGAMRRVRALPNGIQRRMCPDSLRLLQPYFDFDGFW